MLFNVSPILSHFLRIPSILFPLSPNPIKNPFLNRPASSLPLSSKSCILRFKPSTTVSPSASLPKSTLPATSGTALPVVLLLSSFLSRRLILSKPIRLFSFLDAFSAAFPAAVVLSFRFSADPAASSIPAAVCCILSVVPDDFCPVISSVNDLNALASTLRRPTTALITLRTGVNRLIRPCPTVAIRDCICKDNTLHWFAQESDVRAKSPCAADS